MNYTNVFYSRTYFCQRICQTKPCESWREIQVRWVTKCVRSVTDKLRLDDERTIMHERIFRRRGWAELCVHACVCRMWHVRTCGAHPIGSHRDYQVCVLYVTCIRVVGSIHEGMRVCISARVFRRNRLSCLQERACGATRVNGARGEMGGDDLSHAIAETEGKVNRYRTDHKYLGMALHTRNGLCWTRSIACSRCVPHPSQCTKRTMSSWCNQSLRCYC